MKFKEGDVVRVHQREPNYILIDECNHCDGMVYALGMVSGFVSKVCLEWITEKVGRANVLQSNAPGAEGIYLYEGTIYAGCQRIEALPMFRKLGKALGYEVD